MPTNLLLLPLLGGYWFLHTFRFTRFRSQRLDGYRLLLESAVVAVILSGAGRMLVFLLARVNWFNSLWQLISPGWPFFGSAAISLLLGLILPYIANFICEKSGWLPAKQANFRAINLYGNHLLRLLHTAQAQERLVALTLDNNKVYIGTVAAAPNLEAHDAFVSLTPFFSGYRTSETRELVLSVDYLSVYERENLDPAEFVVVVPVPSIRVAGFFDHTIYSKFEVVEEADAARS